MNPRFSEIDIVPDEDLNTRLKFYVSLFCLASYHRHISLLFFSLQCEGIVEEQVTFLCGLSGQLLYKTQVAGNNTTKIPAAVAKIHLAETAIKCAVAGEAKEEAGVRATATKAAAATVAVKTAVAATTTKPATEVEGAISAATAGVAAATAAVAATIILATVTLTIT